MTDLAKHPVPVQHHPNCDEDHYKVCLGDSFALEAYLHERTGVSLGSCDILGHYRSWFDRELPNLRAEQNTGGPVFTCSIQTSSNATFKERYREVGGTILEPHTGHTVQFGSGHGSGPRLPGPRLEAGNEDRAAGDSGKTFVKA